MTLGSIVAHSEIHEAASKKDLIASDPASDTLLLKELIKPFTDDLQKV